MKFERASGRYTGITTPYRFYNGGMFDGWWITQGASGFKVASGSGFSIDAGRKLFRQLQDDWLKRRKARRPKK